MNLNAMRYLFLLTNQFEVKLQFGDATENGKINNTKRALLQMQGVVGIDHSVLIFKNQKQANLNACKARLQTTNQNKLTIKLG